MPHGTGTNEWVLARDNVNTKQGGTADNPSLGNVLEGVFCF